MSKRLFRVKVETEIVVAASSVHDAEQSAQYLACEISSHEWYTEAQPLNPEDKPPLGWDDKCIPYGYDETLGTWRARLLTPPQSGAKE